MSQILYHKFRHISAKKDSPTYQLFLDMVNNPQNYKGYIVYLKEIDNTEIYPPFESSGGFYMNEGGIWQTTDFSKSSYVEE